MSTFTNNARILSIIVLSHLHFYFTILKIHFCNTERIKFMIAVCVIRFQTPKKNTFQKDLKLNVRINATFNVIVTTRQIIDLGTYRSQSCKAKKMCFHLSQGSLLLVLTLKFLLLFFDKHC